MPDGTIVDAAGEVTDLLARLARVDQAADLAGELDPQEVVERSLRRVVSLVPGAEEGALVLSSGPLRRLATGPLGRLCAEWIEGGDVAARPGIGSVLVCPLPYDDGTLGTLVLGASGPYAFGRAAERILPNVANRVCVAVAYAAKLRHLRRAIETRQTIGQACGILIERHKVSPERAFEMLRRASQTNHLKLRDLAARLVETGEEPSEIR